MVSYILLALDGCRETLSSGFCLQAERPVCQLKDNVCLSSETFQALPVLQSGGFDPSKASHESPKTLYEIMNFD